MKAFIFNLQRFAPYGTSWDDTLQASVSNSYIAAYTGDDSIYNNGYSDVTIDAGLGDDTVYTNTGSRISVNGGLGDDTVFCRSNYSTVDGNLGDDTISNITYNSSINGGLGDDSIYNNSYYSTITGGLGDDIISFGTVSSGNIVQFAIGDGHDTIYDWKSDNSISLQSGAYYTRSTVGSSVVISLVSGGAMTLSGASGKTINITGGVQTVINNNYLTNSNSYAVINGTSSADSIHNTGHHSTIYGGAGNDSITNTNRGGALSLAGAYSYISAGDGNDYVMNYDYADYSYVDGGAGADTLYSRAAGSTIYGGSGSDSIRNITGGVSIHGGADNDTIIDVGFISGINNQNTIVGGTGNDLISLSTSGYNNLIKYYSGDGSDIIYNLDATSTLSIGGGSYSTGTSGSDILVTVGSGVITLKGAANLSKLNIAGTQSGGSGGGQSGRYLNNSNSYSVISGSSNDDTVSNSGSFVTIQVGNGNDSIYNTGKNVSIDAGDGRDTINIGYADSTSVDAGLGNDSIIGNNNRTTINAGAGYDTITGNHYASKLTGGADNDLISISSYWYNTIDGGSGEDSIYAGGNYHSVSGGSGNDKISLSGSGLTVKGGTGNDTIYGDTATSHLYQYDKGDGNDLIYNYGSNDSITISGSTWSTSTSGNNVLVKVANSGTITLNGAKGKTLNIYPTKSTKTTVTSAFTAQEIIKRFMKSLYDTSYSGTAALTEAVSYATNGYFNNIYSAINKMVSDCQSYNNANSSSGWNNFLKEKCGIDLSNDDTGAITGYDAGGSSYEKDASGIVYESSNTPNYFTEDSFKINNTTVQLATSYNGRLQNSSYSNLTSNTQRYIWQAFKTWWAKGAMNLVADSYGSNYNYSLGKANKLSFGFFNEEPKSNGTITMNRTTTYFDGSICISVNMNKAAYGSLENGGNSDGKIAGSKSMYLDRVLAHEMTHAAMSLNIDGFGNLPQFITEGTAELVHGVDDDRKPFIQELAKDSTYLYNNLDLLDTGTGNIPMYAAGYMFLRYLAKQGAEHASASNLSMSSSSSNSAVGSTKLKSSSVKNGLLTVPKTFDEDMLDLTAYSKVRKVNAKSVANGIMIIGNQSANSIVSGAGNDSIMSNTGNDTLSGGSGNDKLFGEGGNDSINGGSGNDTLSGGTGNDTLTGGDGKDIFIHTANNDLITDYTPGKDKIKLASNYMSITASSVKGSDVILTVGDYGLITVKGGKNQQITIVDEDGKSTTKKYSTSGGSSTLTLTNSSKSAVTLSSAYVNADASARTKTIKLTGNTKDNSIVGGSGNDKLYGKKGNDTLWGGAGNDSLWGDKGYDTFLYASGEGTDRIFDYKSGDMLKILKSNGAAGGKFKSSSYRNGTLTLGISGGGSVIFENVTTSTTFNINDTLYKVSGNKITKK